MVQGDKIRELTGEMVAALQQRMAANPDVAMPGSFPDVYKERYMACAAGLFGKMGVARDDKARRMAHLAEHDRGLRGAGDHLRDFQCRPGRALHHVRPGGHHPRICLAAHDLGLGTCIEAQLAMYPDIIRRHLGLTSTHKIVVGVALGYPDAACPANAFRTEREPLEKFVQWIE